jgi:G3E family GTPase
MIPVSVITGFLGSGKTTLLKRLLADPRMGETAILINEFGEIGIDHLLLRKVDDDIVLLNSGCLCCTVRDDLIETLDELQAKRASGLIPPFSRAVIETTGLADPAPIIHTLMTDRSLTPNYQLGALVATIDATHSEGQLDQHMEAVKQAAIADRLVITKTDLASEAALTRVRARLSALNPSATMFESDLRATPGPDELFEMGVFSVDRKNAEVRHWLSAEAYRFSSHDHVHHHGHDVNRHDDRISAFCLTADMPLDCDTLVGWLELLLASRGEQVLRLKGVLNIAGCSNPMIIHGVQHVLYPLSDLEEWPDQDRRSRIVFITRDLPGPAIERSFRSAVIEAAAAELR